MKSKLAWIHCLNGIAAAITKQMLHDFNLKKQEMTNLKKESFLRRNVRKTDVFANTDILR